MKKTIDGDYRSGTFMLADGTAGTVIGNGPPLVLLHGVGLDRRMWQAQIYRFARSRRIIAYDLLGHGESTKIRGSVGFADYVRQLELVVSAHKLKNFALIGFSFGGMIAQGFAIRHSADLSKLVLMSTVYRRAEGEAARVKERLETARREGPHKIYPAALERWFSPAFTAGQPEAIQELHHRLQENDARSFVSAYDTFANGDRDLAGQIGAITCPALVMTGELDSGSTPEMARRMTVEIAGARLVIVEDGRHMMPVEMADEVNRELACFLGE